MNRWGKQIKRLNIMYALELDLSGLKFYFSLSGYVKNGRELDEWCNVTITLSGRMLNYQRIRDNILESSEVENLIEWLEDKDTEHLPFYEPYIEFCYKIGPNSIEPSVYMRVNLYDGGATTDNWVEVSLCEEEVQYLITYLKLVTRQIKENDEQVQKMLVDNILVEDYKKHYEKDWW